MEPARAQPIIPAGRLSVGGAGVAWRQTGDDIVVLDLKGSVYFGLNGSAASLWRRMTASASRNELVDELRAQGADGERAGGEVDAFLAQLATFGLLSREAARPSG